MLRSLLSDRSGLVGKALYAVVIRFTGAALNFLMIMLISRSLGAAGAGLVFIALTLVNVGSVFGRLGLDNVLLRLSVQTRAQVDGPSLRGLYLSGMTIALSASLVATAALFVLGGFISERIFGEPALNPVVRAGAFAVIPLVIALLHGELLKGLLRVGLAQTVQTILVPGTVVMVLLAIRGEWRADDVLLLYAAGSWLAALAGVAAWNLAAGHELDRRHPYPVRRLLDSSLPLLWVSSLGLLGGWMATFLLGAWGTAEQVGLFGAAFRASMLTALVLFATNSVLAPRFARDYQQSDVAAMQRDARMAMLINIGLASPYLVLCVVKPELIMSLFGPEFAGGARLLPILAIFQTVNLLAGPVGKLLLMAGHERIMRRIVIIAVCSNLVVGVALIPALGELGAALSVGASIVTQNLLALRAVRKRIGVVPLKVWGWGNDRQG